MSEARMTSKGQITVPRDVRLKLNLKPGDRVLFIVDSSDAVAMAAIDGDVAKLPADVPRTIVFNKIDRSGEPARLEEGTPARVYLCASSGGGIDGLRAHLKDCIGFQPAVDGALSARTRHLDALRSARVHVEEAHRLLTERHAGELVAQELLYAQRDLGEITGQVTSDDLLGRIFGSFCIGK